MEVNAIKKFWKESAKNFCQYLQCDFFKETERVAKKQKRLDLTNKNVEQQNDNRRKSQKRRSDHFVSCETASKRQRIYGNSLDDCIKNFHNKIAQGPVYVCCSCRQTCFREAVQKSFRILLMKLVRILKKIILITLFCFPTILSRESLPSFSVVVRRRCTNT